MSARTAACYHNALRTLRATAVMTVPFVIHGVLSAPSQWVHIAAVAVLLNVAFTSSAWVPRAS